MARPNRPRSIGGEASLADRVAFERGIRGWSYEGMASRMGQLGCAINGSAIYKIERHGRHITVDEHIGFSRVLGIPMEDLLLPAALVRNKRLREAIDDLFGKLLDLQDAQRAFDAGVETIRAIARDLNYSIELPVESAADVTAETAWIVGHSPSEGF